MPRKAFVEPDVSYWLSHPPGQRENPIGFGGAKNELPKDPTGPTTAAFRGTMREVFPDNGLPTEPKIDPLEDPTSARGFVAIQNAAPKVITINRNRKRVLRPRISKSDQQQQSEAYDLSKKSKSEIGEYALPLVQPVTTWLSSRDQ